MRYSETTSIDPVTFYGQVDDRPERAELGTTLNRAHSDRMKGRTSPTPTAHILLYGNTTRTLLYHSMRTSPQEREITRVYLRRSGH
jgi:hypothetical protein